MPALVVHLMYSALKMLAFKHAKLSPIVLMHQFCHAAPWIYPTELIVDCGHMITCDQPLFASSPANMYHLYSPHSILSPQVFKPGFYKCIYLGKTDKNYCIVNVIVRIPKLINAHKIRSKKMDVKITSQYLYTGRALSTREIKSVAYRMSHVKEASIPIAWCVLRL